MHSGKPSAPVRGLYQAMEQGCLAPQAGAREMISSGGHLRVHLAMCKCFAANGAPGLYSNKMKMKMRYVDHDLRPLKKCLNNSEKAASSGLKRCHQRPPPPLQTMKL